MPPPALTRHPPLPGAERSQHETAELNPRSGEPVFSTVRKLAHTQ
jgi:hypothetical protein